MRTPRTQALLAVAVVATMTAVLSTSTPQRARAAAPPGPLDVPVVGVGLTSMTFTHPDQSASTTVTGLPEGSDGGVALAPDNHTVFYTKGLLPPTAGDTPAYDRQVGFADAASASVAAPFITSQDCYHGARPAWSPDGQYVAVVCASNSLGSHNRLLVLHADGSVFVLKDYAYPGIADVAWSTDGGVLYVAGAGVHALPFSSGGLGTQQDVSLGGDVVPAIALLQDGSVVALTEDSIAGSQLHLLGAYSGSGSWTPSDTTHGIPGDAGSVTGGLAITRDGARAVVEPDNRHLVAVDLTTGSAATVQDLRLPGYIGGFAIDSFNGVHVTSSDKNQWRMDDEALGDDGTFVDAGLVTASTTGYTAEAPAVGTSGAPVAAFSNTAITAGGTMQFDASASQVATPGASYAWDFDGNGVDDATTSGPTTSHVYPASGVYNVRLTVTDTTGTGGPSTTYWDGRHYERRGSTTAVKTRAVYVNGNSSLDLSVTPTSVQPGGHFHITLHFTYDPQAGNFDSGSNKITLTENGSEPHNTATGGCNSPITFDMSKSSGSAVLSCDAPTESTVGPVAWRAYFNGDSSVNYAGAQEADTAVTTIDAAAVLSGVPAQLPGSGPLTPTATLAGGCGGGTYILIVDGHQVAAATEIPAHASHTFSQAVASGRHLVKVAWSPASGDSTCTASVTPEATTVTGSNPTTTALRAPLSSKPGPVSVSVSVTSPAGNPGAGTVTLTDGAGTISSTPVSAQGLTTMNATLTSYGPHTLTAQFSYPGSAYLSSASAPAVVSVRDVPGAATVTGTAPRPGKLTVGVSADAHGSPITAFAVVCKAKGLPTGTASGPGPVVTVSGLRNNVNYLCSATATNLVGTGPAGAQVKGRPGKLPTVTLKASSTKVVKGTKVSLSGKVTAADQPQTRRLVTLTVRKPGSHTRSRVATTRTDGKGHFSFRVTVKAKGIYQASAPVGPAVASNPELTVRIR